MNKTWPEEQLEYIGVCPVCGSENRVLMYSDLTDSIFLSAKGVWTMYRCKDCELAYLDPRPTESSIGEAYRSYYTHNGSAIDAPASLAGRLKRALANGYRNWKYGTNLKPSSIAGVIAINMLRDARELIDAGMRGLPANSAGCDLLDFGCGNGDFAARAASAGWNVVGFDIDPAAVEVARKQSVDAYVGNLRTAAGIGRKYDLITLSHVIEHLHNPVEAISQCKNMLKPHGRIWIDTPNIDSFGHDTYKEYWRGLEPPRHLTLFNYKSIVRLVSAAGFDSVTVEPYRPLCKFMFTSSESAKNYMRRQYVPGQARQLKKLISKCEKLSAENHTKREFITISVSAD